eukprot:1161021-Pelagomonas_calceolata.AAC.9
MQCMAGAAGPVGGRPLRAEGRSDRAQHLQVPGSLNTIWISFGHKVKGRGICRQGEAPGERWSRGLSERAVQGPSCNCCQAQTGWQWDH